AHRISAPWWVSTRTGLHCMSASGCSPRISTRPIRGSSRTSGLSGRAVADLDDHELADTAWQLDGDLVVERLAQQGAPQGRVHADVGGRHVEFVGTHDTVG